jgi:putative Ca2+/H+ antiporter (TMEM165/GDT1 family)
MYNIYYNTGAVFLGHFLSDKISEKLVTYFAGALFLFFGTLAVVEIAMQ